MAGMPGAAVAARNGVMAASLAVIVLMGGRALVDEPHPVSAPLAPRSVPATQTFLNSTSPPVPEQDAVDVLGAMTAGSQGTPISTVLTLERVLQPQAQRGRITLRARLMTATTLEPVDGPVTLWRRTPSGRWKAIISDRATSASGLVLLQIQQAGARSVYRLTFAADGVHAASTSALVTVRR
jgi:hypothetical protein